MDQTKEVPTVFLEASKRLDSKKGEQEKTRRHAASGTLRLLETENRVQMRVDRLMKSPLIESVLSNKGVAQELRTRKVSELSEVAKSELERVLGGNDFLPAWFLTRGAELRRTVGRVRARNGAGREMPGTGFLIGSRLLLTNFHVLDWRDAGLEGLGQISQTTVVEFDYEEDFNGAMLRTAAFRLQPETLLLASSWDVLDYALVAVAPTSNDALQLPLDAFGYNRLAGDLGKINKGEPVFIVQHPNGQPKQVVLQNNRLIDRDDNIPYLTYEADTDHGSSGSPVFNRQWEVVALHHSSQIARDANGDIVGRDGKRWNPASGPGNIKYLDLNEGIRISRILNDLSAKRDALKQNGPGAVVAPEICTPAGLTLLDAALMFQQGVAPAVIATPTVPTPPKPPVKVTGGSTFPRPD